LPTSLPVEHWTQAENLDLATYERKYTKGLFNKGVRVLNEDHVGHIMKETEDKIVLFGSFGYRFDVSKSKIKEVLFEIHHECCVIYDLFYMLKPECWYTVL
jgi:hypothetical protein